MTNVESVLSGCVMNGEEMCFTVSGSPPKDVVIGSDGKELIPKKLDDALGLAAGTVSGVALGTAIGLPIGGLIGAIAGVITGATIGASLRSMQEAKKPDAIRHLGPFREVPHHDYKTPQIDDDSLWEKGGGAWEVLARDPAISRKNKPLYARCFET